MTQATATKNTAKATVAQRNAETMTKLQATMAQTQKDEAAKAAVLKELRAAKASAKLKATVAEEPEAEVLHAATITDEEVAAFWAETFGKRPLLGFVCGLATAIGVGIGIGMMTTMLMAMTTSAVLAAGIWVLGFILSMYVGGKLGGAVMRYVANDGPAQHVGQAWNWTKGLFTSSKAPVLATA
jgi:hypothetical protein